MRIEERGSRSEKNVADSKLDPQSPILDPALKRIRWRCRRGLLELDIVLGRFIVHGYLGLDEAQQAAFDALLDMPDNELWDMIAGRGQLPVSGEQRAVLELLQTT